MAMPRSASTSTEGRPSSDRRQASRCVVLVAVADHDGSLLDEAEDVLARLGVATTASRATLDDATELVDCEELDFVVLGRARRSQMALATELLGQVLRLDRTATTLLVGLAEPPSMAETLATALAAHRETRIGTERPARRRTLTRRELDVLRLAARGHTNSEVARALWLSRDTVKFHLANVYRKLGVRSRDEAVRRATKIGLINGVLGDSPTADSLSESQTSR